MKVKDVKETGKKSKSTRKSSATEKTTPIFRFFLSDGTEIESLDGLVVPVTEKTEAAYRLLLEA